MDAVSAAVAAAWLVLIVLAFAMAGLLRQLRDVQVTLATYSRAGTLVDANRELPQSLRPRNRSHAAVLLVDRHCPACAEVAPVFSALSVDEITHNLDLVILSYVDVDEQRALAGIRLVVDSGAYHLLDPGWRPALIILGTDGEVLAAEPAGTEEAIRATIGAFNAAQSATR